MQIRNLALVVLAAFVGGCMQTAHEYPKLAKIEGRDKNLLQKAPYARATIPEHYLPHIVNFHRSETPGSVVVDSDAKFLYLVLPEKRAIRYGIAVGEEAQAFSGVARVGRKAEWPSWRPTPSMRKRMPELPEFVDSGPHNPLGARALYLYQGGNDTLYRIHGTNQPEYIGHAVSAGCIRMTNEDIIDLYKRVEPGATVVVLAPGQGDSPFNPQAAPPDTTFRLAESAATGVR